MKISIKIAKCNDMKAKLLKKFRQRFYYSFQKDTITLFNKRELQEHIIRTDEPMALKVFVAIWYWGISGLDEVYVNERKKEINMLRNKYKHLNL